MDRTTELEETIKRLLAHIDSEEVQGANLMAWVHGYRVDQTVAKKNGEMIEQAYQLVGMTRPK